MAGDQHGPPPGLSEEERRWWQWRKFTWLPGDIEIIRTGNGRKAGETADGGVTRSSRGTRGHDEPGLPRR